MEDIRLLPVTRAMQSARNPVLYSDFLRRVGSQQFHDGPRAKNLRRTKAEVRGGVEGPSRDVFPVIGDVLDAMLTDKKFAIDFFILKGWITDPFSVHSFCAIENGLVNQASVGFYDARE